MTEPILERPELLSPLDVVELAVQELNFMLMEPDEESTVLGFGVPNDRGTYNVAVAEYLEGTSQLMLTVSLTDGVVPDPLIPGLLRLLNCLNLMIVGATFTFEEGEEDESDEIEISVTSFVTDDRLVFDQAKLALLYLSETLNAALPAIYLYVSQKLNVRMRQDGVIVSVLPTVTVAEVLPMIEIGSYGRA